MVVEKEIIEIRKMKILKVTGAIIRNKNNFLICRRGPDEKAAGYWEFPGGKVEKNEKLKDCMARELREELNIDAVVGDLYEHYFFDSGKITYDLYFFIIKKFNGTITKTVHDQIKWLKLEDFKNYNFLPGDGPLIKKLIDDDGNN